MASTPFLARLFATLLPRSLAQIGTNPFLQAPHNIVSSLYTVRFAAKQPRALLYIRLLFAYSQDLKTMPSMPAEPRARPAMPGRFQSIASAGATRPRKEVSEGGSLVTIVFRCELWRCSHRHIEGVHRAAENSALTF